jgi:predicted RNase H-like nuclease (RuvC/YqgF family)
MQQQRQQRQTARRGVAEHDGEHDGEDEANQMTRLAQTGAGHGATTATTATKKSIEEWFAHPM